MAFSGSDLRKFGMAAGAGGIGAGIGSLLFPGNDIGKDASHYLEQIPGAVSPYYQPYIGAGNRALPQLESTYGSLLSDPGSSLNKIGAGYQQSPGFKFALQQALQGAGHAAAMGGMAGSPQHEQQNMQLATNLANQDYGNWMDRALGLFGTGVSGEQGLYNTGFGASKSLSDQIAQALASQAQLSYAGDVAQNQQESQGIGSLIGGIGTLAAFMG